MQRRSQLGLVQANPWLRSTITPRPTLPPAIPLPPPRATSGVPVSAAQRTSCCRSSTPRGIATPAGAVREIPPPPEEGARVRSPGPKTREGGMGGGGGTGPGDFPRHRPPPTDPSAFDARGL